MSALFRKTQFTDFMDNCRLAIYCLKISSEHWMFKSVITREQITGTAFISVHVVFQSGKGGGVGK
jgi:hypothetical protein